MEVHHHPQIHHKEKPWKEYLLEGLMIFIAVTMGFIAESVHEYIRENNNRKELLEIVKLDFEKDLKQLEFHQEFAERKLAKCDSIMEDWDRDHSKINQPSYYDHIITIKGWWLFNPEDKSRNEAESRGYFYLKENSELVYNILRFNFFRNDYKNMEQDEMKHIAKFNTEIPSLTDYKEFKAHNHFPLRLFGEQYGVKNIDPAAAKRAKYVLSDIVFGNEVYLSDIDSMKFYAHKAIAIINKQYPE